jgi:catechol 2,3-dioxygenase-like lactoylglutathione lyase family enzyme
LTVGGGAELILWVASQQRSRAFWGAALDAEPVVDVPGMTSFDLGAGLRLGLMPREDVAALLGDAVGGAAGQASELYLLVDDADLAYERFLAAGATAISPPSRRPWGDRAGYAADPDGHVVAVAERGPRD